MQNRHSMALLAATLLLFPGFAGCSSGGGDGGGSGSVGLSAGANRTVLTSEFVAFTPVATEASGITQFAWSQTAGVPVSLSLGADGTVSFRAPDRATSIEMEVVGSNDTREEVGRDRVILEVTSGRPRLQSTVRSVIDVRGGGEGRAIASAVHTASERLFVIDGVAGDVLAYDVSSPGDPNFLGAVASAQPSPGFSPGAPLSVASGDEGAVAITWSGQTPAFPGVIQLVDPGTLQTLAQVSTTGANPVDVEVTAGGQLVAVACAGDAESVGAGDGFGYVTLVRIPEGGPAAIEVHADLFPIALNPFDGDEAALAASGIRFFGSNPTASVELTPRAVTISPDGTTVWASCPENDALIVIDSGSALITDLVPLVDRSFGADGDSFESFGLRQVAEEAETITTTPTGEAIPFGGITGIIDMSWSGAGPATLRTISAAGPAVGPADRNGNGTPDVTLVEPGVGLAIQTSFTNPLGALPLLEIGESMALSGLSGEIISGQPGRFDASPGLAGHDDEVLDLDGESVGTSLLGARFGGATRVAGNSIWMGEMRRNGLWRFSEGGQLVERYVPIGTPAGFGTPALPEVFAQRRLNTSLGAGQRYGGFGAVASHPGRNSVFAAPRLPLDNPDTAADTASQESRIARLLEIRTTSGVVVGEYVVVLESVGHALEGMTYVGQSTGAASAMCLLEAATSPDGFRGIFDIDVDDATNLRTLSSAEYAAVSELLETTAPGDLLGLPTPIQPVRKTLRADLRGDGLGGGSGQPSALGSFDGSGLYVAFNDSHQLADATVTQASRVQGIGDGGTQFGTVLLASNLADFAGVGDSIVPSTFPIQGLTQPLDLVAIESGGFQQLVTADGGMARVLENLGGGGSFDERQTVGGLLLDTGVFTDPAGLQDPSRAGNLAVSSIGSDVNSDGLVDRLLAFGGRSISVRDRVGRQRWRSSLALERRAFEEDASAVQASATQYGIRPSSLAVGDLDGVAVLAAGLEGASSVMLYDLSQASVPLLSGVGSRATRPVDVDIAAIGGTTLFVTDQARGRIEIRRLTRL
jgi:hypothetical protein